MVKRYDMREFDHSIERYEDGSLVSYDDYAALAERCERLEGALRRISTMNAADDSDYGFNEWGEADCFNQTRILAAEALSGSSGGKDG